jgi:hypothetical protein
MPKPKQPTRMPQSSRQYKNEQRHSILEAKIRELEEAAIEARLTGNSEHYDIFQHNLIIHLLDLYAAIGTDTGTSDTNR